MEEQNMIYQEALSREIVKEGDYFLVKYPDGRDILFRLVKREAGYVMWGMRTTEEIHLYGKGGYDNSFTLADNQVRKEYSFKGVFEEVHALGLPKREHTFKSYQELRRWLDFEGKENKHPDDVEMNYALASHCVASYNNHVHFYIITVVRCNLSYDWMYSSNGDKSGCFERVRPEATPNSTMRISVEGCDGSKEKPWICLSK